jgi:nucleoside-diphosphate-sugar epimerase
MNAAVTGGTGFLGRALVQALVGCAEQVRVLVRKPADDEAIQALGAVPIRGDLTAVGGCDSLVRPGDIVFHTVARVDLRGRWGDFRALTIEGTGRLLDAALAAEPARVVYVSSAGVYLPAPARGARFSADETTPAPARYNLYGRAKLAAENLVRARCAKVGCPWTILRLGATYGPGKRQLLTHFRPLLREGRLRIIGKGDNAIAALYVDDAARAVLLAGTHPAAADKVYDVAGDERVTQREWFEATADALEVPRPRRNVPRRVAYAAAAVAELWARVRGADPPFNRAMVVLVSTDQLLDAARIRDELGWRPEVSFQEGMRRTHEWFVRLRAEQETGLGGTWSAIDSQATPA